MQDRGNGSGGPEDVDAAFAEIVADLESEGLGRDIPPDGARGSGESGPSERAPSSEPNTTDTSGKNKTSDRGKTSGQGQQETSGRGDPGGRGSEREDPEGRESGRENPGGWRSGKTDWDPTWRALDHLDDEDEHYHPPEPPPIPRPNRGTVIVLLFLGVGFVLLAAPGLIGLTAVVATPVALVAITCGLGLFLLSKRHGPPPGAGSDGAQV